MNDKKQHIKRRLPGYKAPENIWLCIEQKLDELDKSNTNSMLVSKLPNYEAPDLFANIVPEKQTNSLSFNWMHAAASVAIILGLTFGFKLFKQRTITEISYSIEESNNKPAFYPTNTMELETNFNAVLNYKCQTMPKVCDMPDYKELHQQLKNLEQEEQNLKQALKQLNSPELENHLIRITNNKIKLETYILKLFS